MQYLWVEIVADAEFEARRLAELLEQANYQLAQFGQVTKQTQEELVDAQMKAKFGINNYGNNKFERRKYCENSHNKKCIDLL